MVADPADEARFDHLARQNEDLRRELGELKDLIKNLPKDLSPTPQKVEESASLSRIEAAEKENELLRQEMARLRKMLRPAQPKLVAGTPREIGETVEQSVKAFLEAHVRVSEGNDAKKWAGMFATSSNYCYLKGRASRSALAADRQKLINRYRNRSCRVRPGATFTEMDGGRAATVSFTYDYAYSGSGGRTSGACHEVLKLKWYDDRWLITDFNETVIRN